MGRTACLGQSEIWRSKYVVSGLGALMGAPLVHFLRPRFKTSQNSSSVSAHGILNGILTTAISPEEILLFSCTAMEDFALCVFEIPADSKARCREGHPVLGPSGRVLFLKSVTKSVDNSCAS